MLEIRNKTLQGLWQRQENIKLVVREVAGAYERLPVVARLRVLVRAELQPSNIGMSWKVGKSVRDTAKICEVSVSTVQRVKKEFEI